MQTLMLMVSLLICGFILIFISKKAGDEHKTHKSIVNYRLLLSACFDDENEAKRLIQREKEANPSLADEDAAERALDHLLSDFKQKRDFL